MYIYLQYRNETGSCHPVYHRTFTINFTFTIHRSSSLPPTPQQKSRKNICLSVIPKLCVNQKFVLTRGKNTLESKGKKNMKMVKTICRVKEVFFLNRDPHGKYLNWAQLPPISLAFTLTICPLGFLCLFPYAISAALHSTWSFLNCICVWIYYSRKFSPFIQDQDQDLQNCAFTSDIRCCIWPLLSSGWFKQSVDSGAKTVG